MMSIYNTAAFNLVEQRISYALCFDDGLVLVTVDYGWGKEEESRMILYRNVLKNLEERLKDIVAKLEEMKNDKLEEMYRVYIGGRIYVILDPICKEVIFREYESIDRDCLKTSFIFNMNDFEKFLTEWPVNVDHMKMSEMHTSCSPLHPCIDDGCLNCKMI